MAVYTSVSSFEEAEETEFRRKVREVNSMKGGVIYTEDGDWTEEDLLEDIEDEARKILKDWVGKNEHRAIKDKRLLHSEFLAEEVNQSIVGSLIDYYNKCGSIDEFDSRIRPLIMETLNKLLITE